MIFIFLEMYRKVGIGKLSLGSENRLRNFLVIKVFWGFGFEGRVLLNFRYGIYVFKYVRRGGFCSSFLFGRRARVVL